MLSAFSSISLVVPFLQANYSSISMKFEDLMTAGQGEVSSGLRELHCRLDKADQLTHDVRYALRVSVARHAVCVHLASKVAELSRVVHDSRRSAERAGRMATSVKVGVARLMRQCAKGVRPGGEGPASAREMEEWKDEVACCRDDAACKRSLAEMALAKHDQAVVMFDTAVSRFHKAQRYAFKLERKAERARNAALESFASMEGLDDGRSGQKKGRGRKRSAEGEVGEAPERVVSKRRRRGGDGGHREVRGGLRGLALLTVVAETI